MFFATVVIAAMNGLIFLPVVLSFLGPHSVEVDGYLEGDAPKRVLGGSKRTATQSGGDDFSFSATAAK
jgi:hypothetical protein